MLTLSAPIVCWLILALYGIFIQRWALVIAWRKAKVASFFGKNSAPWINSFWVVPAEMARLFVVSSNLCLGIFIAFVTAPQTVTDPERASTIGFVFSGVLIVNEVFMVTAATLSVIGYLRMRRHMRNTVK